jgi:transcriptional regulator with XRE-family HTH domain
MNFEYRLLAELKVLASWLRIEPMVHADDLRAGFSDRLKKALADSGISQWGAQARLAKEVGVTPKAASKWVNGETVPGPLKLMHIANWLNVRREWLQYGEGEMRRMVNQAVTSSHESEVNREQRRAQFAARLNRALDDAEGIRKGHGRIADFRDALANRNLKVSLQAARKWLVGESFPEQENVETIAKWLGVDREWLQFGEGPMRKSGVTDSSDTPRDLDHSPDPARTGEIQAADLMQFATPRTRTVLERINQAARAGRLSEADLDLLDQITARFEGAANPPTADAQGNHKRLRKRLQNDDPHAKQ